MKIEGFTINLGERSVETVQDAESAVVVKSENGYTIAMIYSEDGRVKVEKDFSSQVEE